MGCASLTLSGDYRYTCNASAASSVLCQSLRRQTDALPRLTRAQGMPR